MTDTQVTWLTEEAFDRLKAELDQLIANRPVIAAEINDRREEGDLETGRDLDPRQRRAAFVGGRRDLRLVRLLGRRLQRQRETRREHRYFFSGAWANARFTSSIVFFTPSASGSRSPSYSTPTQPW